MTLGQILKENREKQGFKLEEVSRKLNITQKYLIALESGDYSILPAKIYVHCFLKLYGELLALNTKELIDLYSQEVGNSKKEHTVTKKNIIKPITMWSLPRVISGIVLLIGLSIFLGYIGMGVYRLVQHPFLEVDGPQNNIVISENFVEVVGRTHKEVQIYINNNHILADELGEFRSMVSLQKGVNIIKIVAKNRHGKESIEYRKILYDINSEEDLSVVGR